MRVATLKENVREYLVANGRITKLYASKELGTDAIKDTIYALRKEGVSIATLRRRDFSGKTYTEWKLIKKCTTHRGWYS